MQTLATVAVIVAAIATVAAIVMYLLRQHARAEVAALQGRVRVLEHDLARERATRQAIEDKGTGGRHSGPHGHRNRACDCGRSRG
jgi:hypothetical protein